MDQSWLDPKQLSAIGDLSLLARTVVRGFYAGMHRGLGTGASAEFSQYRPYTQGDDPRFLDWKLYARSDRLYLKQYRAETGMHCSLLLDCSGSMDYGSQGVTKFDYARMLAASLGLILKDQGDQLGLVAYHHELISYTPPQRGARAYKHLLAELSRIQAGQQTDTPQALKFLGDVLKPRGMVILISDLLHPIDEVLEHLKSLRARRHDCLVFQVEDPSERSFQFEKAVTLRDVETEQSRLVVPDHVKEQYLQNRKQHFDRIEALAVKNEIDLVRISTHEPLDQGLRHFFNHRNQRLITGK